MLGILNNKWPPPVRIYTRVLGGASITDFSVVKLIEFIFKCIENSYHV